MVTRTHDTPLAPHPHGLHGAAPFPQQPARFTDLVAQPANLERLQCLKIMCLSGGTNVLFDPWSTGESYDLPRRDFGTGDYLQVVVRGYGHFDSWMGKEYWKNVDLRVRGM
jgi:hypothetical protein